MSALEEGTDPRPLVPTSPAAVLLWTLVTAAGFGLLGSAGLPLHGFVFCAVFQSALLFFWNRQLSWRWLLGTLLFGVSGGLLAMLIVVIGGLGRLVPEVVAVALSGAVGGVGVGLGGFLALRSIQEPGAKWVLISAAAWTLGCGITVTVLGAIDPHGMEFFQQLTSAGLSDMTASRLVGARSGSLTGLIAGAVSAVWAAKLLKQRGTRSAVPA